MGRSVPDEFGGISQDRVSNGPSEIERHRPGMGHACGRQPGGVSVYDMRDHFEKYGGVMVYEAGFRLPYYGVENDWLGLEFDHSHRRSRSQLLPEFLLTPRAQRAPHAGPHLRYRQREHRARTASRDREGSAKRASFSRSRSPATVSSRTELTKRCKKRCANRSTIMPAFGDGDDWRWSISSALPKLRARNSSA